MPGGVLADQGTRDLRPGPKPMLDPLQSTPEGKPSYGHGSFGHALRLGPDWKDGRVSSPSSRPICHHGRSGFTSSRESRKGSLSEACGRSKRTPERVSRRLSEPDCSNPYEIGEPSDAFGSYNAWRGSR